MEKKAKNRLFGVALLAGAILTLSSCNSFCNEADTSNFMFGYDGLNTTLFENNDQGIDYIKNTFINEANFDQSLKDTFSTNQIYVSVYNETTKKYEEKKLNEASEQVFGEINGNLKYLKVNEITAREVTAVDDTGSRRNITYTFGLNSFTKELIESAKNNGSIAPSNKFFEKLDQKIIDAMIVAGPSTGIQELSNLSRSSLTFDIFYGYSYADYISYRNNGDPDGTLLDSLLHGKEGSYVGRNNGLLARAGYVKYYNEVESTDYFYNLKKWENEILSEENVNNDEGFTETYLDLYRNALNAKVVNTKTCITVEDGFYGHTSNDPLNDTVLISGKSKDFWQGWGEAFTKHGFFEGLLVYPISIFVENLSHAFGMNGVGQILAVLVATAVIRLFFMLVTLPSTISQQKMQFLQPELTKLQQKYPNANTNNYEKQKMAQAQMALYKKYKVHPFSSMLVMIIQFPIFISVWNALTGSASLSRDAVLGLRLSDTIWNVLTDFTAWPSNAGWWTALVLILLMSASQILSMFVPQWLNKSRIKTVGKTKNSASADQTNKTMKYTQIFMTVMIIIMGFNLPSAMGVYWFAGALFSIAQSVIMHFVFINKSKKGKQI